MSGQAEAGVTHYPTSSNGIHDSRWVRWCLYALMAFPIVDFALRLPHVSPIGLIWDKVVLFILASIAVRRWIAGYRPTWFRWQKYAVWFMVFTCALMFAGLAQTVVAVQGFRIDIYYILYTFLIPFVVKPKDVPKLLHVGAMVAVLIGIHGIYQYITKVPTPANWTGVQENVRTRVFSVLKSPNELGSYMALNIPLLIGMAICEKNRWRKWMYTAGVLICGLTFLFTLTRAPWVALVLSLLIMAVLFERRLLLGLIVLVGVMYFIPPVQHRINDLLSPVYWIKSSQSGRIFKWITAFDRMSSNPLFGVGVGRYGGAVAATYHTSTYSDNYYAKTFGETGLIGLTLFIAMHLALVREILVKAVRRAPRRVRYIFIGGLTGLVAVLIHNAMENVFEYAPMAVPYFMYAMLLLVWSRGFGAENDALTDEQMMESARREEGIAYEARE